MLLKEALTVNLQKHTSAWGGPRQGSSKTKVTWLPTSLFLIVSGTSKIGKVFYL